ncbi:ceramide synthase isoform X2 [Anas platyrhynchos]|uniref:ceramide synthase isoform X2 n=1 Tax=Anas platyrhynchos TaxID=8839 RepID=UPI003AF30EA9
MAPPGAPLAGGLLFFPGLFLLAKSGLRRLPGLRWPEPDAVIVAARLVSSVQAVMASTAGYIISSSCHHVIDDQHWLAGAYPQFAVPYFVYDVYAMFLCHRHRARVKGHEAGPPPSLRAAAASYLRKDLLMVLHHAAMVLVCFPVATLWRQGKGDFFLGCLLMAELSTPFVCLGKVLILYKRQHTALHKLNGVAMHGIPCPFPVQTGTLPSTNWDPQPLPSMNWDPQPLPSMNWAHSLGSPG